MSKVSIVTMYVGESGVGKTHNMCSYPKVGIISTEPNHHHVWQLNPELGKNVIDQEYFIPTREGLKDLFKRISAKIQLLKERQAKGEIETLGIDNLTYLIHNRWLWQNKFQTIVSPKTGELDTRSMYGQLRTWCYEFMLMDVLTFKGNIVCNLHEMLESDEALDKKIDKSIDKVPNILGGFRNDIAGLFSNCFYLSKLVKQDGTYKYLARTNKGAGKNAKNRFNLPTIIEDVTYQRIRQEVDKVFEPKKEVQDEGSIAIFGSAA